MRTICGLFGYTRQAYYKQLKSNEKHRLEEEVLLDMIKSYRKQMPRIGGAKLHYLINQSGYRIGRKVLYDILRDNKLLVRRRKKYAVVSFFDRNFLLFRPYEMHCLTLLLSVKCE